MSEVTVKGSCLCGGVKYKVTGETERLYHCHCKRCRKASGTGHAGNLLITPQARIFRDSRATWSCEDALPVYAEYPPEI